MFCDVYESLRSFDESVKKCWTVESVSEVKCYSPEDDLCENYFKNLFLEFKRVPISLYV